MNRGIVTTGISNWQFVFGFLENEEGREKIDEGIPFAW